MILDIYLHMCIRACRVYLLAVRYIYTDMSHVLDLRGGRTVGQARKVENYQLAAFFVVAFIVGAAYLAWLDYGCTTVGVMTWAGKVCM